MGKRSAIVGGIIGAAVGVVLAPRSGGSRREALQRLRLAARPGKGAVRAFAGTPCAAEDGDAAGVRATPPGGAPSPAAAPEPRIGGGDDHG
ncbi:MAG: hypothetical protein GX624_03365 [Actinobacteria bacterium]|nr:hypothetical protein [Actinomycetota bacterium]